MLGVNTITLEFFCLSGDDGKRFQKLGLGSDWINSSGNSSEFSFDFGVRVICCSQAMLASVL